MTVLLRRGRVAVASTRGPARLAAITAAAAAITAAIPLLEGCAAASSPPLVINTQQRGAVTCAPTPNKQAGFKTWNTQIGFVQNYFYNNSGTPLTIESVRLIEPHNVALHHAVVYEMVHEENALGNGAPWSSEPLGGSSAQWRQRQTVPGAVLRPAGSAIGTPGPRAGNEYQILVDISASTPHDGWTTGLRVSYRASGKTYTARLYIGYAIAPYAAGSVQSTCGALTRTVEKQWRAARPRQPPQLPTAGAFLPGQRLR
jgi:hypothetical protein